MCLSHHRSKTGRNDSRPARRGSLGRIVESVGARPTEPVQAGGGGGLQGGYPGRGTLDPCGCPPRHTAQPVRAPDGSGGWARPRPSASSSQKVPEYTSAQDPRAGPRAFPCTSLSPTDNAHEGVLRPRWLRGGPATSSCPQAHLPEGLESLLCAALGGQTSSSTFRIIPEKTSRPGWGR